jgi:UDP-glucose 4-epimerase
MNLGTGIGYSVKQVVAAVERITGRKVPTHIAPRRPGDPPELVADPSLAEKLLKWKAKRSLDDIISTAWKWAQKSGH